MERQSDKAGEISATGRQLNTLPDVRETIVTVKIPNVIIYLRYSYVTTKTTYQALTDIGTTGTSNHHYNLITYYKILLSISY